MADEVEGQAAKQKIEIKIGVARLRARHGGQILPVIRERIRDADALLFDLGDNNPNVYLELGMALALQGDARNVFVLRLKDQDIATASDLAGFLFTEYRQKPTYSLVDARGFRAALKAALLWRLRQKGILLGKGENDDEDLPSEKTPGITTKA